MRIIVVDPLFSTLPYDRALCTALVAQGHDVTMLARSRRPDEEWPTEAGRHEVFEVADVFGASPYRGWRLRLHTLARHLRYALQIQKIMLHAARHRSDIVHFQWCLTPVADAILVRRLRGRVVTVLTVHDTTPFNGSKVSSFLTAGLQLLMQSVDHLIVHTKAAAETLAARGLPARHIFVIPHGLLQSPKQQPDVFEPTYTGIKVRVLLFGHVKRYKGTDILIRAAALLPNEIKARVLFTVAGQLGLPFNELERLCEEQGVANLFAFDLRFLTDEEADAAMRQADIFVFPYREIQASGVFTLAMQYGRPIVASNLGIFRDYVIDDVNGLLVPPEDPGKLAEALERLIASEDTRDRMGRASAVVSRNYPTWAEIADRTTEVYWEARSRRKASYQSNV